MNLRDRLGIDFISVLGLPPVAFVDLAADLDCRQISIGLKPLTANPHDYPAWSLREDKRLQRELLAALRDRDVSISIGEGVFALPNKPVSEAGADMDIFRELGAKRINFLSLNRDRGHAFDQCATFVEMACARGLETHVEFVPGLAIGDLPTALDVVKHVGGADVRVVIDAMHLYRSGSSAADIREFDPALIGHVQICDVPLISPFAKSKYGEEAVHHRLPPGQGELPLHELFAALPADCIVGIETPMLTQAQAGVGPRERLEACLAGASAILCEARL